MPARAQRMAALLLLCAAFALQGITSCLDIGDIFTIKITVKKGNWPNRKFSLADCPFKQIFLRVFLYLDIGDIDAIQISVEHKALVLPLICKV